MGKLVVALLVGSCLVALAGAEEKKTADAEVAAQSSSGAPAKSAPAEKKAKAAKPSGRSDAAAPDTAKTQGGEGAGQKPCEPVKPCPIDG